MTARRRLATVALGFVLPALGASAPLAAADSGDATASRRSCGTIPSTSTYPHARVIAIRGVSCARARSVARRFDRGAMPPGGWRCGLAHDDGARLFSCGSGGRSGDLRSWPHALEAVGTRRAARASACGTVSYGGRGYVLSYRGLSCADARRNVRYVHRNRRLDGWRCSSGSSFRDGGYCRRGRRYFAWHPGD